MIFGLSAQKISKKTWDQYQHEKKGVLFPPLTLILALNACKIGAIFRLFLSPPINKPQFGNFVNNMWQLEIICEINFSLFLETVYNC